MTEVAPWIQELVEDVCGAHLEVGMITTHPKTGKKVKIVNGQYWGTYGLSNFWYWRNVLPNGKLGKLQYGYGWSPK